MEEYLATIAGWFVKGTLTQFQIAFKHYLASEGYAVERQGDALLFYRIRKEGGFLGIGRKTLKEPVMKIIEGEEGVQIPPKPLDEEFVQRLASYVAQR